jgi:WD40 repeat protein
MYTYVIIYICIYTGLALSLKGDYFASCGEDQFFQIWKMPDFNSSRYTSDDYLLFNEKIDNHLCTGLVMMSDDRIAVGSYDDDNLILFQKQ